MNNSLSNSIGNTCGHMFLEVSQFPEYACSEIDDVKVAGAIYTPLMLLETDAMLIAKKKGMHEFLLCVEHLRSCCHEIETWNRGNGGSIHE